MTTDAPEHGSYSAIVTAGRPALWDVGSLTPYAVFKDGAQWHRIGMTTRSRLR